MRRCRMLAFVLAGFLVAPSVWAQTTTGVIRGVITDDSGGVLPGVTVTLKGPATAGTPTTTTNEAGIYRFPNLAPGAYQITAELTGFNTSTQTGIQVALGGTTEVGVQLKISTQQETVTVVAQSPVVDATTTQVTTNYSREWVENAPVRRFSFFDLVNAAPGVSASTSTSSRSQSFGSATNENVYLIDGTDFTAPLTGAAWPWPNTDAIEEIQVLSLGAPADYGNLGGAVFNVVTRQGSNTFHGDANFYFQNQSLTGRNTTDAQDSKQPYHRDEFKDTTVQVGGPVDEGQALVLRVVPIPEGRRFAARHRPGVSGALVGQAVLLEGQLPAEPGKPLSGPDARRLLPHPGTRHRQHRAEHPRRGKRAQPVAGCAVDAR